MKIIIDNIQFEYNIGCKILKTKYGNKPFKGLEDFWDDIVPITFVEIVSEIKNIEQRRVAIKALGIERIAEQVNPKLINSQTIRKTTHWVDEEGNITTKEFDDTYELYEVEGKTLFGGIERLFGTISSTNFHFVKFKDTSTDREYLIWVDINSVKRANRSHDSIYLSMQEDVDAIHAIAWTFQTNLPEGGIKRIIRQGDCILLEPKPKTELLDSPRHLRKEEYLALLEAES